MSSMKLGSNGEQRSGSCPGEKEGGDEDGVRKIVRRRAVVIRHVRIRGANFYSLIDRANRVRAEK